MPCAPQVRAIFEAAVACARDGVDARPDIMVPLVGTAAELANQEALVRGVAEKVMAESGVRVSQGRA